MAVAVEAMNLFESSRAMSRELLRIRDIERMQVASQIHDEPLQRISMIANQMSLMSLQAERLPKRLVEEFSAITQNMQETNKQLRDICAGLHPPLLKQGAQWAIKEVGFNFRDSY